MQKRLVIFVWLLVLLVSCVQLLYNTSLQSGMAAFLPSDELTAAQPAYISAQSGPAARLWLIALEGDSTDMLIASSRKLAHQLRESGQFSRVSNGDTIDPSSIELLKRYRYLISASQPADIFTPVALRLAMETRLDELRSPLSSFLREWIANDPTGEFQTLIARAQRQGAGLRTVDGVWLNQVQDQAFLLAETYAEGLDFSRQDDARSTLYDALNIVRGDSALMAITSGVPAIALDTRDAIQSSTRWLSVIATLMMTALLWLIFRSPRRMLLTALPLAGGILVAAAVTAFTFGYLHAITLAFGITILGVAVDYPIHLFSHNRINELLPVTAKRIWPVLRLGVVTTVLGYAGMSITEFTGMAQLGVFSITGLLTAALMTYTLLPHLDRAARAEQIKGAFITRPFDRPAGGILKTVGLVGVVLSLFVIATAAPVWSEDIAELSPVPASALAQEHHVRQALGRPSNLYFVAIEAPDLETQLQNQEALAPHLEQALAVGEIGGYRLAATWLPSLLQQQRRQSALPDGAELRSLVRQAVEGLPFRAAAFDPFINDVVSSKTLPPLRLRDIPESTFKYELEMGLQAHSQGVSGIVRLSDVNEPGRLDKRLRDSGLPGIRFVDVKGINNGIIQKFMHAAFINIGIAFAVIIAILVLGTRSWRRSVKILFPMAGAAAIAAAAQLVTGQPLTLFHLVSLFLVIGISLDYGLFFSQPGNKEDRQATLRAIITCMVSTVLIFVILCLSPIPLLRDVGSTVSTGAFAAFLLAWLFSRPETDKAK